MKLSLFQRVKLAYLTFKLYELAMYKSSILCSFQRFTAKNKYSAAWQLFWQGSQQTLSDLESLQRSTLLRNPVEILDKCDTLVAAARVSAGEDKLAQLEANRQFLAAQKVHVDAGYYKELEEKEELRKKLERLD